jgi:hypothetical protein
MFVTKSEDGRDETAFDFDALIPMPPILNDVVSGGLSEIGAALVTLRGSDVSPFSTGGIWQHEIDRIRSDVGMPQDHISKVAEAYLSQKPDMEVQGILRLRALADTGYSDWHCWCKRHWGTKWNAYGFEVVSDEPLQFTFKTAWSFPLPVFQKLAETFPALNFDCACYDEGDCFAGRGFFNPPVDQPEFALCKADEAMYELVYGHKYEPFVDDDVPDSEAAVSLAD